MEVWSLVHEHWICFCKLCLVRWRSTALSVALKSILRIAGKGVVSVTMGWKLLMMCTEIHSQDYVQRLCLSRLRDAFYRYLSTWRRGIIYLSVHITDMGRLTICWIILELAFIGVKTKLAYRCYEDVSTDELQGQTVLSCYHLILVRVHIIVLKCPLPNMHRVLSQTQNQKMWMRAIIRDEITNTKRNKSRSSVEMSIWAQHHNRQNARFTQVREQSQPKPPSW